MKLFFLVTKFNEAKEYKKSDGYESHKIIPSYLWVFSKAKLDEMCQWITSLDELNMNVFRYNIGGGEIMHISICEMVMKYIGLKYLKKYRACRWLTFSYLLLSVENGLESEVIKN